MAQYDGSIRINTAIDVKRANAQLATLENNIVKGAEKIASLQSKMDELKKAQMPTQQYEDIVNKLSEANEDFDFLLKKQEQMQREGKNNGAAWDRLLAQIEKVSAAIHVFENEKKALEDSGKAFEFTGKDSEKQIEKQSQLGQQLQESEASQAELVQRRGELLSTLIQDEVKLAEIKRSATVADQKLIDLLEQRKEATQRITDLQRAGVGEGYQEFYDAQNDLSAINEQINAIREARAENENSKSTWETLKKVASETLKTMAKGLKGIPIAAVKAGINGIISSLQKMGNMVQKSAVAPFKLLAITAKKAFSSIGKSSKASNNMFQKGFKNILKYGLGIRSFYALINKFRTAVKEGFSNLYNDTNMTAFKSQVDGLKASLLTLKNSFAAAFRPIVEVAIPYIQKLIDYMTSLLSVIGQFMAAITGQKNYTKAIKQTTAAIEDQGKAQNKQLSGLDKLNNLTSGGGGGGAGSGANTMFEEAPVDERWQNIAQWLKDMWAQSDFTELGNVLGEKLKQALDSVSWDEIKERAHNIGASLATLINGAIETDGLGYTIGNTLAQGINTAFNFLNSFVHSLHWESIGIFIADSLNGLFQNIDWNLIYDAFVTGAKGLGDAINSFAQNLDWETIASTVSNFINTFIDTIYTFITTVDWAELGTKVGKAISDAWTGIDWAKAGETLGEYFKAFFDFVGKAIENVDWWAVGESVKDFLVGIDWAGVAESFFEAVGAALGGLAAFLSGLLGEALESVKEYFREKTEEMGGNGILGFFKGIGDAIVGIADWIWEHIFTPFIDGFKNAFGIHSPSTVMEEQGEYIIRGLLGGILNKISNISSWIKENISQPFIDGFKKVFGIHSPSTVMEEQGEYITKGLLNGITSLDGDINQTWESMKESATAKWSEIKENLNVTWENMKTTAETNFKDMRDYIADKWADTENSTDSTWDRIKETVSSIASDISGVVNSKFTEIIGSFGIFSSDAENSWVNTWENIKNRLGSILGLIKDAVGSAFDWISDKIGSIGSTISGAFSSGGGAVSYSVSASPYSAMPQMAALSKMEFPGYATGQVIPTSMKKHLAWLGDNKRETEVVSPLSTIEEAVENAMLRVGGIGGGKITLEVPIYLNNREIARGIQEYDMQMFNKRGKGLFEH